MKTYFGFRKKSKSIYWKLLETVIISTIVIAAALYFRPGDPLFVTGPFPWILLAPIIMGLFYGLSYGVISLILVFLTLNYFEPSQLIRTDLASFYLLGCVVVTFVCGEFSSFWRDRLRQIKENNRYIESRMDNLSRAYYTIRLSHDRLEKSLINKPVTLRSALLEVRQNFLQHPTPLDPDTVNKFLELLSQYCSLDKASMYRVKNNQVQDEMLGQIGAGTTLHKDDPLIRESLEDLETLYHAINETAGVEQSHYVAVSPLITSSGECLAILLIEEVSFWALNETTLKTLAMLMTYFADDIIAYKRSVALLKKFPECPLEMASELTKLIHLKKSINLDSSLVGFRLDKKYRHYNMAYEMLRQRRGLDFAWQTTVGKYDALIMLLPLAGPSAVDGYIERMREMLQQQFGIKSLSESGIVIRVINLYVERPDIILADLFKVLLK
jgi:polysaccharide biosynthesis protein PelD